MVGLSVPWLSPLSTDTVISVMRGNFGDSDTNKGYIVHFSTHMREAVGLKTDVIIVLLNRISYDAGIPAIREHLRQKLAYLCLYGFSRPFSPKRRFWGQNRSRWCDLPPPTHTNSFLLFGCYLCATFGENRSRNATVKVPADRQTDAVTDTNIKSCKGNVWNPAPCRCVYTTINFTSEIRNVSVALQ